MKAPRRRLPTQPVGDRTAAAMAPPMARLIRAIGSPRFGRALIEFLRTQVFFDSALILVYRPQRRPQIVLDLMQHGARENRAEHYVAGAYLLDPFYLRARALAEPVVLRMRDIAPSDFLSSDYYVTYYKRSKVIDEVNYLVPDGHGGVFVICVERSVAHEDFAEPDLAILSAWLPVVAASCARHAALEGPPAVREPDLEHERLSGALAALGRSVLTAREHEIVQLMLQGLTAPAAAARLKVSVETVRVHRRNIYDKLRITSLAELFSLALRAIHAARRGDVDPLPEVKPTAGRAGIGRGRRSTDDDPGSPLTRRPG